MFANLTYQEALNRIENSRRFGNLPGVEVSKVMLAQLGNPLKDIPYVHVAGTNGKGSTCAFLTQILMEAGFKVGTFTSPHLVDFEERIQVNNQMISKENVRRLANELLQEEFTVTPTMFDYCLMMAVLYFKEENCDIAIMETGLGGKLDSTNALGTPEVSIITKIGFDHMAILGDSLAQIAGEKAGIIKDGSYVVLHTQEREAGETLRKQAKLVLGSQFSEKCHELSKEEIAYAASLPMQLLGTHQKENAAGAIAAARCLLTHRGFTTEKIENFIREGVAKTTWGGRMEVLCSNPFLLVDGAHNGHGVAALRDSLLALYPGEKFHFIMGVMADKDYENMIEELLPLALDFKTITVESSRALQGQELAECIQKKGIPARQEDSLTKALEIWLEGDRKPTENKTICFGSLYFIGEVKALFVKNTKSSTKRLDFKRNMV